MKHDPTIEHKNTTYPNLKLEEYQDSELDRDEEF